MLFCVNHTGISEVAPADHIDPEYGRLLREAAAAGVEVIAWQAALAEGGEPSGSLSLTRALPVLLD